MTFSTFITFIKLLEMMYDLQRKFFAGDKKVIAQCKMIEKKVDQMILSYNYKWTQNYEWERQMLKIAIECRTAQHDYFAKRTPELLNISKECEHKLITNIHWIRSNYFEFNNKLTLAPIF